MYCMRVFVSVLVGVVLFVLSGCAATNASVQVNPATGTLTGTLTQIPGEPARNLTREVSPCGESRGLGVVQTNLPYYGRVLTPAIDTATRALRGEVSMGSREFGRAVRAQKDALLVDRRIEWHNAKVAQDATENRSMWSATLGFFGYHRKPIPMVNPNVTVLEASTPMIIQAPAPSDIPSPTNPDGSFSSADIKGLKAHSLEARVAKLELLQAGDHERLAAVDAKIDQKFEAIMAAIQGIKK